MHTRINYYFITIPFGRPGGASGYPRAFGIGGPAECILVLIIISLLV